jgi:tRNA (guanine-N7-)-methyltransferase
MLIKTDHDDYANQMIEVIERSPLFELTLKTFDLRTEYPKHLLAKYTTKFEKIFISQNIPIKGFVIRPKVLM